jgi:SAM-dependent methyltransferase
MSGPDFVRSSKGAVLGDSALQSSVLEALTSAVRYRAWLTEFALPYLGTHPLEIGSGLGDYAASWLAAGVPRFTVSDLEPDRLALLRARFGSDPRVEVRRLDVLNAPKSQYTSLVAFNVLEHVPDHVGVLRAAHRLVVPGGAVVIFVPAFPFAMSEFDRALGHVRRYTRRTLRAAYDEAGLTVECLHYVNAPGLPAWFVGMRLMRMRPRDGRLLRCWDTVVVPFARGTESLVRPPFGQSLFAVGRVPGQAESRQRPDDASGGASGHQV